MQSIITCHNNIICSYFSKTLLRNVNQRGWCRNLKTTGKNTYGVYNTTKFANFMPINSGNP